MTDLRTGIPAGKTRVIWVDLFDHSDGVLGDYDSADEAQAVADRRNDARTGPMDTVYYAYDDHGRLVAGGDREVSP